MHIGDDVLTVKRDRRIPGGSQHDMQDKTARPSEMLIFAPANIASVRSHNPHSSASPISRPSVSEVILFFAKSAYTPGIRS